MQLQFDGVEALIGQYSAVLKKFPERRAEVVGEIAKAMQTELQGNIGGGGKVRSWQETYFGSKGGYAAVRPRAKTYQETKAGKRYAVGHVTNSIDSGHRIRPPSGKNKRYRPRFKQPYVRGKQFYAATQPQVDRVALAAAERLVDRIVADLEG